MKKFRTSIPRLNNKNGVFRRNNELFFDLLKSQKIQPIRLLGYAHLSGKYTAASIWVIIFFDSNPNYGADVESSQSNQIHL